MCGKYRSYATWREYIRLASAINQAREDWEMETTVTPFSTGAVIRLDESGERRATPMRWVFESLRGQGGEHMHARSETIDTKPTFARAFADRRGIILCSSFNEGEEVPTFYADGVDANRPETRQWTIRERERGPIAIAVIWQIDAIDGRLTPSFTMVTTPANALIGKITDRMPAILRADDWEPWLGERDAPLSDVKSLLRTYEGSNEWEMFPEDPKWRAPVRRYPPGYGNDKQGSLF